MYEGEFYMVFTRPLAAVLAIFTVFSFVFPLAKMALEKRKKKAEGTN
jgi:TctA family transporter